LIEAIVIGNERPRHVATVRALVTAGADINVADGVMQATWTQGAAG
tara:strand:- start:378 stop:515 length:138 start_codon:yes stop_codon:yes gene_type:complete